MAAYNSRSGRSAGTFHPKGFENTLPGKRIALKPGEYFASNQSVVISTLLGSCVAACLWDPLAAVVGMNHFLLASKRYTKSGPLVRTEAGKYGVHAMELLINDMMKFGAQRKNLRAKVFGGGNVLDVGPKDNFYCVGEVNCRFILEFLKTDGIPLISSDLGGTVGRVIYFSSHDYSVYVRKIERTKGEKVAKQEKGLWVRSIEQEKAKGPEPELWL